MPAKCTSLEYWENAHRCAIVWAVVCRLFANDASSSSSRGESDRYADQLKTRSQQLALGPVEKRVESGRSKSV